MKKGVNRRQIMQQSLMAAGVGVLAKGAFARSTVPQQPPNILFILADDLGFADLSCYGARAYKTPVLDKLAQQGVKLTQAYANSAVCSATRTALMTGRYQYRLPVGLEEPVPGYKADLGLPPTQETLPGLLKKFGYKTALVGKWHLGAPPNYGPTKSGFDHFFGFYQGVADYFTHLDKAPAGKSEPYDGLYEDDHPVSREGYLTDVLADDAIRRIENHDKAAPFLISLHFNAPHWPWEGPHDAAVSSHLTTLREYDGGSLGIYGEMVGAMDAAIGRVLGALDNAGAADNTIVIFTSDNGGERFSDVWPFIGMKGELLEGGLRIPAIVRWPGRLQPGYICDQVMISMDWAPTLVAAAGDDSGSVYAFDGINILPQLERAAGIPRKLFWRYRANEQSAVREGDWKYLSLAKREYLFDVVADQHERADLKEKYPEIFARLKSEYVHWNTEMLPYPLESYSETPKGHLIDRY